MKAWWLQKSEPWDNFLPAPGWGNEVVDPEAFTNKRVLITGAGGYIGSALVRALHTYLPEQLILLDHAEYGLYRLAQDLTGGRSVTEPVLVVGSVCDEKLVHALFSTYSPHIVFHAAALKHLSLMEANAFAAIQTNTLGMHTIAEAAAAHGVQHLVLLSTDKAADPISIMGASKRLAELIVLANQSPTLMTAVRLCNVLGSSGSVAPYFLRQIEDGKSVTVTHPETTRYFLSIVDTVRLLLLAGTRSTQAELLVPRLGLPTSIVDLARFLIDCSSRPTAEIEYTCLRPGEKLHECVTSRHETLSRRDDAASLLTVQSPCWHAALLHEILVEISNGIDSRELPALLKTVQQAVPEYSPSNPTGQTPNGLQTKAR